jgi:hypothetical protein
MKSPISILIISCFLTSCATILNKSTTKINIYTTEPSEIILNTDTLYAIDNKARLIVQRSNDTIYLNSLTDKQEKTVLIAPKFSPTYLCNIFNYGIGFLIERKNPKRFTYPSRVFVDTDDPTDHYSKYGKANFHGELYLHFPQIMKA